MAIVITIVQSFSISLFFLFRLLLLTHFGETPEAEILFFLQGNQSKQFLDKVDLLERELMNQPSEAIINGLPFTQTIKAFNKVVGACFGLKLDPAYKAAIAEFKRLYLELDISVLPQK